jgi:hypothetical protein
MAAGDNEALREEFWNAVEAHRDEAGWKDEAAIADMTDGAPEATQHVIEYMVAAYTEEQYDHVQAVWENLHQDMQVARMLYGFGAFIAEAASGDEQAPLEVAEGEFYGPASETDVDTDIARINEGYDVFDAFASDDEGDDEDDSA